MYLRMMKGNLPVIIILILLFSPIIFDILVTLRQVLPAIVGVITNNLCKVDQLSTAFDRSRNHSVASLL